MTSGDRPYLRSAIGKSLYEKIKSDEQLKLMDKSQWYAVDLSQVDPSHAELFLPLGVDDETEAFLERCHEKSDWIFSQLWHSVVKAVLTVFMTHTSVNGLLRRGSMFVFSRRQFVRLLGVTGRWRADRLLDLGSGDGSVTQIMAEHCDRVSVTEISSIMRSILHGKGFAVLDVDTWHESPVRYDLITCLNVLDRCDRPLTLLQQMRAALKPGGLLVVALVLPLAPYVEQGVNANHKPVETMDPGGSTFARQVSGVINNVFTPAGLRVERWSRLPYLCEGDLEQAFYWLSDAVFVLRPESEVTETRPEVTEPRPEVTEPRPEVKEPRPEVTEPRPEVTEPRPEVKEPRPEVTEPRPEVTVGSCPAGLDVPGLAGPRRHPGDASLWGQ
ncbi:methyltransferase-like protein 9 [Pollicipes pollicipes]|uniref:methyltransferase-like protein 9 n=1 Tax=Pollicipes pollicipes TaxID=41117 RepID=UPI001884E1FA|nr:methyltransferase-like protein 9 [Pollicipes pollicipes]XP_037086029.1 methyltransferase-like protein 9 [Pollicipes pollicipes]XP_037086030.1 methyltransferase-like protein 9 [Pollicipes pollicipes]